MKSRAVVYLFAAALATPALATQPCPPGTDVWHASTISTVLVYAVLALAGVGLLTRMAIRATPGRRRFLLGSAAVLSLFAASVGGFLLVMGISWSANCL